MGKRYSKAENELIESSITFLVEEYGKTGVNEKPVIFHSLRVACLLVSANASATTVTAAVLHDLIEDSQIELREIKNRFGAEVATLVDAVSFKSVILDKKKQYIDMFQRTIRVGREATLIKCADILDNTDYYSFGNDRASEELLLNKLEYFFKMAKPEIGTFELFRKLRLRYSELETEYKSVYKLD